MNKISLTATQLNLKDNYGDAIYYFSADPKTKKIIVTCSLSVLHYEVSDLITRAGYYLAGLLSGIEDAELKAADEAAEIAAFAAEKSSKKTSIFWSTYIFELENFWTAISARIQQSTMPNLKNTGGGSEIYKKD